MDLIVLAVVGVGAYRRKEGVAGGVVSMWVQQGWQVRKARGSPWVPVGWECCTLAELKAAGILWSTRDHVLG